MSHRGQLETRGDIAILWVDHPPVNAIDTGVKRLLVEGLARAQADPAVRALVIACRGRTFMAGADIREFDDIISGRVVPPDALAALAAFGKPLVAAIHGSALGGGLEVALACDHRVASADASLGLPEVHLGLLPGWGGTQRLPRLVGPAAALDFILAGQALRAPQALAQGLIDLIAEGELVDAAVAHARSVAGEGLRRLDARTPDIRSLPSGFFEQARERLARDPRGLHAPQRIVDCVEAATRLPVDQGLAFEREQFMRCLAHPQSAALRHAFLAEREAAVLPDLPPQTRTQDIASAAVVGAGTMGSGIAIALASAGIPVVLLERDAAGLERGMATVRAHFEAAERKGRLSAEQARAQLARVRPTLDMADLGQADLVIEAVFELMDLKKQIFRELDRVAKPAALLASNTSFLSIDEMAAQTSRPGQVLGLHFFAPAQVMRLLEVVRGASSTSPQTLATAMRLARRLGKVGVVAGNCDGFIGNRMVAAYLHQADLLVLEGATPSQVDAALRRFGMAMGPFQMYDLSGLDLLPRMRRDRGLERYDPRTLPVCERLVERGRHGQKTQAGYHDYGTPDRAARRSPEVEALIRDVARELGMAQREITDEEIVERCILALFNTGCEVLGEGMAYRAGDIDTVYLKGYAFPAHRGGPMFWGEHTLGLDVALGKIERLSEHTGTRWLAPSAHLRRWVAAGASLHRPPAHASAAH